MGEEERSVIHGYMNSIAIIQGFLVCLLLALAAPGTPLRSQDWERTRQEDGILVYLRKLPGHPLKQVKITLTLDVPLETALQTLDEVAAYPQWVYRCRSARVLERRPDGTLLFHTETELPWPLHNRDVILLNRVFTDSSSHTLISHSEALPHFLPEQKGVVRVPYLVSRWEFRRLGPKAVHITYFLDSDPGGLIPG
ncbi:MAG: hypothetical protein D6765_12340, partial [Bacteroidetes bacterium]